MADRPQTPEDVKALVEEHGIRFVRLWFTDILGQLKSFSISAEQLDDAFEGGMGFDGSSITGFNAIEESDMIAVPDPTTFNVLPWRPGGRAPASRACSPTSRRPSGRPYEGDPRHVLRRAEERAREMGFDAFNVGPELEYYLFRDNRVDRGPRRGRLLRPHDARRRLRRPPRHRARARAARASTSSTPTTRSARRQHEIDMRYSSALKMADDCMTYRITVKEYALKYGWHATFMPKPLFGQNGSGMHTHQSLFKDGRNAFYDAGRQVLPVRRRQGVHRRPAAPRARDLLRSSPSG